MHAFEFLDELVIVFGAAVFVTLLFQKLRIPVVIGMIATGIVLGPMCFGIVYQDEIIKALAELGVVMLLFTIGLEFSLEELKSLKRLVLIGGPLQIVLTAFFISILAGTLLHAFGIGVPVRTAILLGLVCSVSSTAICVKMLRERGQLGLLHGRASMGILIFQDLALVPLVIIISMLDPNATVTLGSIILKMGGFAIGTVLLVLLFRFILPRLVGLVDRASTPEILTLGALFVCFGAAFITSQIGLSMALGAFLAGAIIAGTDHGHRIGRSIEPLRDALTSVFFVSVGLLLDLHGPQLWLALAGALGILVVKSIVVTFVLLLLRMPVRTALITGLVLSQVGELSFVLAEMGQATGLLTETGFQSMLVAIVATMIATPSIIIMAPWLAKQAAPALSFIPLNATSLALDEAPLTVGAKDEDPVDVAIIGFGVVGSNVADVLRATKIPFRILDMNRQKVDREREAGEPMIAGDGTDAHDLTRLGVRTAKVVVVAINDQTAVVDTVHAIRTLRQDCTIIVRSRFATQADDLAEAGADVVIIEEFESSIQVLVQLLTRLGVNKRIVAEQEEIMRRDRYTVFGDGDNDDYVEKDDSSGGLSTNDKRNAEGAS